MSLFTIEVAGRALLVFPEKDSAAAEELATHSIGPDLQDFEEDGEPLWDGEEPLSVRPATASESALWDQGLAEAKATDSADQFDADSYAVLLVEVDAEGEEDEA
ncbi:hypothetical protein [Belnapia rosea]|jgi:hypothetical protein|uniref:Uncharacterized protein n=1 Tax=Belnapia rosea TaxID=938405 RepID=A0A1G6KT19_9PROT|nr:hypothetical protein [Belnapia rosea]SDB22868.1 hypothetical protein SAMN02927895_00918 [Belnapia rosea]SDC33655.1 hypothetical protein SAMN04487779_1001618 [Belnapia rosea]